MKKKKSDVLYQFASVLAKKPLVTSKFLLKSMFHQVRGVVENPNQVESLTYREKSIAWEKAVYNIVLNNKPLKQKPHSLPAPLIVSLTSFAPRFSTLVLTLQSLLAQTMKPDKILLWISREDEKYLTQEIKDLEAECLEVRFCEDIGPHKKYFYTLQNYPAHFIITADDDLYYWPTWIEELVENWSGDIHDIVAFLSLKIYLNKDKLPGKYLEWIGYSLKGADGSDTKEASILNFALGGAGALYPPDTFYSDVLNYDNINKLCPSSSDIWLHWMSMLNYSKVRTVGSNRINFDWPDTQIKSLWKQDGFRIKNKKLTNKDFYIKAMIDYYGFPIDLDHD